MYAPVNALVSSILLADVKKKQKKTIIYAEAT